MSKRQNEYPNGKLIKCAACGHVCIRGDSEYPPKGTPIEKIRFQIGTLPTSLFCTNTECNCYTIYCLNQSHLERQMELYKQEKVE